MDAILFVAGLAIMVVAAWMIGWQLGLFMLGVALIALAVGLVLLEQTRGGRG